MTIARNTKIECNIHARTNSLTTADFKQREGHTKIMREFEKDLEAKDVAAIYLLGRESQYPGMIAVDYGHPRHDGGLELNSVQLALLDMFSLAPKPESSLICWREVSDDDVPAAIARLAKLGLYANLSQVTKDVTSKQAQSLFPAIQHILAERKLPNDASMMRILIPSLGQRLHGHAVSFYGSMYAGVADVKEKKLEEKLNIVAQGFRCPIALMLMRDPVLAEDGNYYERSKIETYIAEEAIALSPIDRGTVLTMETLSSNEELRHRIHAAVLEYPILAEEFWEVHRDAIVSPLPALNEIEFSARFRAKYPHLIQDMVEAPRRMP